MSASFSKSLRLSSSLKMEEEAKAIEKQGIVSILGSDCERSNTASLRRTLSADMSSKKWLAKHGLSPMKKIASSEEFPVSSITDSSSSSSSSEGEEEYEDKKELEIMPNQFNIVCTSIQSEQKKKKEEVEKPGQFDIWSTILSQKADDELSKSNSPPTPYIHPLVKRSMSALSEKSLEVCTENLGSETGSEGFSSYPQSETGNGEEDNEEVQEEKVSQPCDDKEEEELQVMKYNCYVSKCKTSLPRSFPPPLPSCLHMRSHRKNGRLVLEAVSVPSQNYFLAQRQDGRLLLTFVNSPLSQEPNEDDRGEEMMVEEGEEDMVDEFENFEEEEEEEEEEEAKEMGIGTEEAPKLSSGVTNVHRSAPMIKKIIELANRNPTWPHHRFNKVVNFEEEEEPIPLSKSLPPPPPRVARLIPSPPATASACFNAYEYCWKTKPASAAAVLNPLTQQPPPLKNNSNKFILSKSARAVHEQQQLLALRRNQADYLVPLLRGCKEPRRSLQIWEPYCIATS